MHDCILKIITKQCLGVSMNGMEIHGKLFEFRAKEFQMAIAAMLTKVQEFLKRKNKNQLKLNIENYKKLKFNDFAVNYKSYLNLIEYEDLMKIIKDYE